MTDYDVTIIGAGNGGLTAAATLAKAGLKVLLLERHNVPGDAQRVFAGEGLNLRSHFIS